MVIYQTVNYKRLMAKFFNKKFHKNVGRRIKELREEKGITQEFLSLEIGAANSYMGIIENAHRDIPLSKLYKIAEILEVEPYELLKVK